MRGIQTRSAADTARELDIHCVVHRIVWDLHDYREVRAYCVPKNPTDDDKAHCMGRSCIHWTWMTLEYKPWYHCGENAGMVVVTMLRSDVYRLLHMCHVLIKVTVTF